MKPGYRYRYPPYLYRTDTDIPHISHIEPIPGSYRFFSYRYRYRVSVPGIGTWYRYHTGYRSNSKIYSHINPIPPDIFFKHRHIRWTTVQRIKSLAFELCILCYVEVWAYQKHYQPTWCPLNMRRDLQ